MRALIGAVAVLVLAGASAAADEKVDAKKLIGKWEPVEKKDAGLVVEFADKGKLTVSFDLMGKTEKIEGTYKLDKDKLEIAMTFMGEEKKETLTVTKLTDDELVTKDSKGKEEKLKRMKAK